MSWLKSAASETQITHGDRLWLYCLAGLIMFLLVIQMTMVQEVISTGVMVLIVLKVAHSLKQWLLQEQVI